MNAAHASSFADAALEFRRAGLNVIPVITGAKRPPRGFRWRRWQKDCQTGRDLDRLRSRYPDYGTAVILGGPGGLVDLDVDGEDGEMHLNDIRLPVPETAEFASPRGRHRLYRSSVRLSRQIGLRPNLDVLGAGYVVVPPSLGRRWLRPLSDLNELPGEWLELLRTRVPPPVASRPAPPKKQVTREGGCGAAGRNWLADLYRDAATVRAVAAVLGIPGEVGRGFRCILPGHGETSPSASLGLNSVGIPVYYDWHERDGLKVLTLPEVRAALAYGEVRQLRGPGLATWGLRLLVEAGVLHPVRVEPPPLPDWEPPYVRQVYDGFLFLLGCKWLHTPGAPTAFSWRFAAAWCGVPQKQAGEAIHHLCYEGYMHIVDPAGPVTLFLPGPRHAAATLTTHVS
ncbi:MAG TPA: bifunctional DNA primase/polymerase [bacterium]|nr:bifunctional DNA primase/polymerase [bacterium]